MNTRHWAFLAVIASGILTGCQTYHPKPIATQELFDAAAASRRIPVSAETLSFHQAAAWMSEHNPELQRLRSAYQRLSERATLKTPLPNPSVELGLAQATRLSPAVASKTQPFVGLGFTIPLGKKRAAMDDIRQAEAALAEAEIVTRHRELHLELRRAYLRFGMIQAQIAGRDELVAEARALKAVSRKLAEAGVGSGLDVSMADVEIGLLRLQRNELQRELLDARSALAQVVGVPIAGLMDLMVELPNFDDVPAAQALETALAENHTGLARLRAQYAVAEMQLRLEIERQYPDLEIGSSAEQDPGEKTRLFGLGATLALPIFDRNEIAILEAEQHRESIRSAYQEAVSQALGQLEAIAARRTWIVDRSKILNDELLPTARKNMEVARDLAQSGNLDVLRYLEISRGVRELALGNLDITSQKMEAALALEKLTGLPFMDLEASK